MIVEHQLNHPNEQRHIGLGTIAKLGGFALAPFTGGASIPIGLGVGGAIDAGQQQGRANQAQQEGLDAARADLAARQPFRDQLFQSLQNPAQRQDLSNVFGSENPFASALGPLDPQAQQATAPVMPGPGGIDPRIAQARGLGLRGAGGRGGGSGRFREEFIENERRFGGRFGGDN